MTLDAISEALGAFLADLNGGREGGLRRRRGLEAIVIFPHQEKVEQPRRYSEKEREERLRIMLDRVYRARKKSLHVAW